jgi:hypothetical protein
MFKMPNTDSSIGIGMSTVFVNQSLETCNNNNENRLESTL